MSSVRRDRWHFTEIGRWRPVKLLSLQDSQVSLFTKVFFYLVLNSLDPVFFVWAGDCFFVCLRFAGIAGKSREDVICSSWSRRLFGERSSATSSVSSAGVWSDRLFLLGNLRLLFLCRLLPSPSYRRFFDRYSRWILRSSTSTSKYPSSHGRGRGCKLAFDHSVGLRRVGFYSI